MKLSIVLPTFNERENVEPLLNRLFYVMEEFSGEFEILFIDDSTDDTPEIIKGQIEKYSEIRMIHRVGDECTGLATAFIRGFEEAQGEYILCMDTDLQHPPEKAPELLRKAIDEEADVVVGSRYIKGGSAIGLGSLKTLYGIYRRAVSVGLKYFIQIIFIPIRKTTDPGSGFFLFRKSILSDVELQPKGFKILIEVLMRAKYRKVSEIPIVFAVRENDDSKATIGQGIEFLRHVWFIFRTVPEAGRFLKFCIVGSSGVVVNLGILILLVELFLTAERPAYVIAVAVSILTNYFFNSFFTYGDKKSSSRAESMRRVLYYYAISVAVMLFNFAIFSLGLSFGLHYIVSAMIGILIATLLNFILATKLVWKLPVKA
ncbi:MAG: glycosyltransferase family 2 protein [Patescibacteria group bacterium]|nr:glycosyltransferase family 2 protein [Patescibacteria group bacterium]